MNDKYLGYCMNFSNEELKEYLVDNINLNTEIIRKNIRYLDENGDDIQNGDDKKVKTIVFDGNKEELFISFFGPHTSIFVFDIEIMFIDESIINTYTLSDIFENVVYEGELRKMTHNEILEIFSDIISCFINADSIKVDFKEDNGLKNHKYFSGFKYIIDVYNSTNQKNKYEIGNITINY